MGEVWWFLALLESAVPKEVAVESASRIVEVDWEEINEPVLEGVPGLAASAVDLEDRTPLIAISTYLPYLNVGRYVSRDERDEKRKIYPGSR